MTANLRRTVGYVFLSDRAMDEQLYEICGMSSPAVRIAVLSHAAEQSGPITASTGPSSRMRVSASRAADGSQATSFQL
jgi:hypothetical protein